MDNIFPHDKAKEWLIDLLDECLPDNELKKKSEFILNLHLRHDTLAMPNMSERQHEDVIAKIIDGSTLDEVAKATTLEDTSSKKGMLRVMVRTHLNRSGISDVSKGYKDKTRSPRILNFIDTISPEINPRESQIKLINNWFEFAINERNNKDASLQYDDDAIDSLKALKEAYSNNKIQDIFKYNTADKLYKELHQKNKIDHRLNWYRIILGIFSGLNYLNSRNWDLYEQATKENLSYREVDALIQKTQKVIPGYGYALAGSFLADLGGSSFVKDDTHVEDCMTAISKNLNTPEKRVEAVIKSAKAFNTEPRFIDKVMYIAGSGNLPLIGIKLKCPIKKRFIAKLVSA
jgi:hypothetical protein